MDYIVKRHFRQKNLRMHFNDKAVLIVSCPYYVGKKQIAEFVEKNKPWIDKQLSKYQNRNYTTGETLPFFGKNYNLVVSAGKKNQVLTDGNNMLVSVTDTSDKDIIRKALLDFYRKNLQVYVSERIEHWLEITGFPPVEVKISNAKTTWGVCYSSKNLIKFSAMTAILDEDLIDMIVVHELCHLKYHNHSAEFWNEVSKYIPDLDAKKKQLKKISQKGEQKNLF